MKDALAISKEQVWLWFCLLNCISIDTMTSTSPSHQRLQTHAQTIDNSDLERSKTPKRDQGQTSDTTTPTTKGTHGMMNAELEDLREVLLIELGTPIPADDNWTTALYSDPPMSNVEAFLSGSELYDSRKKRWIGIPRVVLTESELYGPFITILDAILKLHGTTDDGVKRVAHDTHNTAFYHRELEDMNTTVYKTRPDLTISATGPSFEQPKNGARVGYSNAASVFDVKLDRALGTVQDHIAQLGSYARCVFFPVCFVFRRLIGL